MDVTAPHQGYPERLLVGRPADVGKRERIMAVPKSKVSRSRRGMRRSHLALEQVNVTECSNCGEMKRSHHMCLACGHYDGREVVEIEAIV